MCKNNNCERIPLNKKDYCILCTILQTFNPYSAKAIPNCNEDCEKCRWNGLCDYKDAEKEN